MKRYKVGGTFITCENATRLGIIMADYKLTGKVTEVEYIPGKANLSAQWRTEKKDERTDNDTTDSV